MEPSVTTLSGVRVAMEETAHHPLGQREERREKRKVLCLTSFMT